MNKKVPSRDKFFFTSTLVMLLEAKKKWVLKNNANSLQFDFFLEKEDDLLISVHNHYSFQSFISSFSINNLTNP